MDSQVAQVLATNDGAKKAQLGAKELAIRLVLFACFFGTLPIYSPNMMVLHSYQMSDRIGLFVHPIMLAASVISIVVVVLSLSDTHIAKRVMDSRALSSIVRVSPVMYLTGYLIFLFALCCSGIPEAVVHVCLIVGACICALGLLPCCTAWSRLFEDINLRQSIIGFSLVMFATGLIGLFIEHLAFVVRIILVIIAAVAGVVPLIKNSVDQSHVLSHDSMDYQMPGQQITIPAANIKAFLSVMGMALVGMSISAIVVAIQPTFLFSLSVSAQRLGSLIAAVPMLLVIPFCARRPTYPFVYQIVLPGAAALSVVAVFFGMLGLPADIPVLLAYIFYGMVNIAVVATANAVSGAREFPRHLVFSALIGSFCVMTLMGLMLGSAFDGLTTTNHTVFLALMTVLYGVALLLTGCIRSWSLTVRQEGEGQQDNLTDQQALSELLTDKPEELSLPTFEEAVARVSQEGGLTPREQEILSYIGRGHSSVYVAKTLLISESTVYTHVRNIYRKLGVNGREQLILLIGKVR